MDLVIIALYSLIGNIAVMPVRSCCHRLNVSKSNELNSRGVTNIDKLAATIERIVDQEAQNSHPLLYTRTFSSTHHKGS